MTEKTVFQFSEISPIAQRNARDRLRAGQFLPPDWWDTVYEDADCVAKLLGIQISPRDNRNGHPRLNIYFSGFWSQGDGACFAGKYRPKLDALEAVTEYAPQDETLHAIARDLTVFQVTARMVYGAEIETDIKGSSSNYYHSHTMYLDSCEFTNGSPFVGVSPSAAHINELLALMRRFADWVYFCLEAEYEYLISDESLDEILSEHEFDEDGVMI